MMQTMFEKLQLHEEKNILIQGLPSAIEKQFIKLSFAKNVTPLLRSRKIDFALVFAINQQQLTAIMHEVIPALHADGKLWIAYPKAASKIVSDLNRECSWDCLTGNGFENIHETCLDHVWSAIRFQRQPLEMEITATAPMPVESANNRKLPKQGRGYEKVASSI
jgi:hypothetical protein